MSAAPAPTAASKSTSTPASAPNDDKTKIDTAIAELKQAIAKESSIHVRNALQDLIRTIASWRTGGVRLPLLAVRNSPMVHAYTIGCPFLFGTPDVLVTAGIDDSDTAIAVVHGLANNIGKGLSTGRLLAATMKPDMIIGTGIIANNPLKLINFDFKRSKFMELIHRPEVRKLQAGKSCCNRLLQLIMPGKEAGFDLKDPLVRAQLAAALTDKLLAELDAPSPKK